MKKTLLQLVAVIGMVPESMRDALFDALEEFIRDRTTGPRESFGLYIMQGIRLFTNTPDDEGQEALEPFADLLADVVTESRITGVGWAGLKEHITDIFCDDGNYLDPEDLDIFED